MMSSSKPIPLSEWFSVSSDDERVTISARPPQGEAWEQSFLWMEIERICFKAEGLLASDGIYVFTSQRPESFVIPTEAKGGSEFWAKVIDLGLFSADLAIQVMSAPEGTVLCWPPHNELANSD
jgi:hypothetical protein